MSGGNRSDTFSYPTGDAEMISFDLSSMTDVELTDLQAAITAELAQRQTASEPSPVDRAWAVATGQATANETAMSVIGARNDYNSKGRGSTMARRVLRNGAWEWLSAPASRGRTLAADRNDTQRGFVYEGEIIAEYTLGSGQPKAEQFYLVTSQDKPLARLNHTKIKGGYRVTRESTGESMDVSDPTWR